MLRVWGEQLEQRIGKIGIKYRQGSKQESKGDSEELYGRPSGRSV